MSLDCSTIAPTSATLIKAEDNRWMHRPPMDWTKAKSRHDPTSIVGRIYNGFIRLITARKSARMLHCFGLIQPLWTDNNHVFALSRSNPMGHLLLLANFHEREQAVKGDLLHSGGLRGNISNILTQESLPALNDKYIHLGPYESLWLVGDQ